MQHDLHREKASTKYIGKIHLWFVKHIFMIVFQNVHWLVTGFPRPLQLLCRIKPLLFFWASTVLGGDTYSPSTWFYTCDSSDSLHSCPVSNSRFTNVPVTTPCPPEMMRKCCLWHWKYGMDDSFSTSILSLSQKSFIIPDWCKRWCGIRPLDNFDILNKAVAVCEEVREEAVLTAQFSQYLWGKAPTVSSFSLAHLPRNSSTMWQLSWAHCWEKKYLTQQGKEMCAVCVHKGGQNRAKMAIRPFCNTPPTYTQKNTGF